MNALKYAYYFAIFLVLHMLFWLFTGMTLWAPVVVEDFRAWVLVITHIVVFMLAGIYLIERKE